jgi:hypothetical protein
LTGAPADELDLVGCDRAPLRYAVGGHDDRHAALSEGEHQGAELPVRRAIESGEGLIEQQHPRVARERPREQHAARLAVGELAQRAMREPGEAEEGERAACGAAVGSAGRTWHADAGMTP